MGRLLHEFNDSVVVSFLFLVNDDFYEISEEDVLDE